MHHQSTLSIPQTEAKKCGKCHQVAALSEFYRIKTSRDGLDYWCKPCRVAYNREWSANNVEKRREYVRKHGKKTNWARNKEFRSRQQARWQEWRSTLSCTACGESEAACLDFHHLDPATKEHTVAYMIRRYSWKRIMAEVEKCIVLCSNCHRKLHAGLIDTPFA